jgi:uncharacterized membrane protein
MLHKLLLYIHILSAIASIGTFFVFIPIVRKLRTAEDAGLRAYLDSFRVAIRLAKHAGHVLVLSGVGLIYAGFWSWETSWIVITLAILVSSLLFLARAFSPTIRAFDKPDSDKAQLVHKLNRSVWIYLTLLMIMLAFMVVKPNVW